MSDIEDIERRIAAARMRAPASAKDASKTSPKTLETWLDIGASENIFFGTIMTLVGLIPYALLYFGSYLHEVSTGNYGRDLHWIESLGMNLMLVGSFVLLPVWPILGIIAIASGLKHRWKLY